MGGSSSVGRDAASSLTRLVTREAELEAQLDEARGRSEALVRDAEAAARAMLEQLDRDLDATAQEAERRRARECAAAIAAVGRERAVAVERLRRVAPARITALAEWVVSEVLREAEEVDA